VDPVCPSVDVLSTMIWRRSARSFWVTRQRSRPSLPNLMRRRRRLWRKLTIKSTRCLLTTTD